MLVLGDPFFDTNRNKIIAFAAQQKLPAMYHFREYVVDSGLMSYGTSLAEAYREVGVYAAKILKGAKPSDLTNARRNSLAQTPAKTLDAAYAR